LIDAEEKLFDTIRFAGMDNEVAHLKSDTGDL
jgi:hypothetical protein